MEETHYRNMSGQIRALMMAEVELDGDRLPTSVYFTRRGAAVWKELLLSACRSGDEISLAATINSRGILRRRSGRLTGNGARVLAVPSDAHETIAGVNFSRFYLRALCRHALDTDVPTLTGYRAAGEGTKVRARWEKMIGAALDTAKTLAVLRTTIGRNPERRNPLGAGSGILACLPL